MITEIPIFIFSSWLSSKKWVRMYLLLFLFKVFQPLLIIGYVHDTDRLHSMSLPKKFQWACLHWYAFQSVRDLFQWAHLVNVFCWNVWLFKEEYKDHKCWTATIMTEHNGHQQNFELPPPIFGWGQTSSFLLGLEKMIEQYNSR